jgi:hypothetical protein
MKPLPSALVASYVSVSEQIPYHPLPLWEERKTTMEYNAFERGARHLRKKQTQVRLRGGQTLQGMIHIPDGLSLLHFLGTKKYFLNLTSVKHLGRGPESPVLDHLSLRLSNVVWIIPMDDTLHISSASIPTEASRQVEIQLADGVDLSVELNIAEEQRMSDYLDANWAFIPLWSAKLRDTNETIQRLAVNHEAILAIREVKED